MMRWWLPFALYGSRHFLTALLAGNGWLGQYLEPMGIKLAFTPAGVVITLIFDRHAVCGAHGCSQCSDAEERKKPRPRWVPTACRFFTKVISAYR
jgi:hypothetical protein